MTAGFDLGMGVVSTLGVTKVSSRQGPGAKEEVP